MAAWSRASRRSRTASRDRDPVGRGGLSVRGRDLLAPREHLSRHDKPKGIGSSTELIFSWSQVPMGARQKVAVPRCDDDLLAPRPFWLPRLRFGRSTSVSNHLERQFTGANEIPDTLLIEGTLYGCIVYRL